MVGPAVVGGGGVGRVLRGNAAGCRVGKEEERETGRVGGVFDRDGGGSGFDGSCMCANQQRERVQDSRGTSHEVTKFFCVHMGIYIYFMHVHVHCDISTSYSNRKISIYIFLNIS